MRFKIKVLYYLLLFKTRRLIWGNNIAAIQKNYFPSLYKTLSKSPLYKKLLFVGFTSLPIIDKKSFMEHFDEINTCGISKERAFALASASETTRDFTTMINGVSVGLSSGTSGNRGLFLVNMNERARWVASVLDRVLGITLKKRTVAFFLRANSNLYSSVNSRLLKFHFFDLLNPLPENLIKLQELQPAVLVGQPSLLIEIARAVKCGSISISPQKIVSVAEVLTPEDGRFLRSVFNQVIHQVYQCTEGFLAATCSKGVMHFNEDFIVVEKKYIDDEHKRFHPIITDLLRTSQPVVRYELNDIIIEGQCTCGSKALAIEQIVGRADDILLFYNVNGAAVKIFPDFFRNAIITSSGTIEEYALIQKTPLDLYLFIKSADTVDFEKASAAIYSLLGKYAIQNVRIIPINDNGHKTGTKLRRIKNEISS